MAVSLDVLPSGPVACDTLPRAPVEFGASEYVPYVATDAPAYDGPYEVVPSREAQTLPTGGRLVAADVTVAPIPSNYGLITWDGAVLTVS